VPAADEFIDYTKHRPEDSARNVDLVLDTVGGPDSRRLLHVLKPGGALFPVYLAEYDPEEVTKLGVTTSATQVRSSGQQLEQIARLIEAGTLRVAIDSTYRLADAQQAHERAACGHIEGKIVLTVS
jgi:NADPH:quinone reductase-like Zn-dependent oxidoreductase